MRFQTFISGLALLAPALASNVLDLTPANFDSEVFNGKPTLVEFFAPWCGHCKKLAPIYEELADSYQRAKSTVNIASVDGDEHKELGTRFGISGFPTIKYFDGKSKEPIDYTGGRDLESFQEFIADKAGVKSKKAAKAPSEVTMLGDKDFHNAIGQGKGVFAAFTAPWCGHCKSLAPTWESLAHDFSPDSSAVSIVKVDAEANKKVAESQGVSSYPTIKYFPAGSTEGVDYQGGRDEKSLVDFVNEQANLHRLPGGSLDLKAGTVDLLDQLVVGVSGKNVDEVLKEVQNSAKSASDVGSEYYVKVLQKLQGNKGYLEKEAARLQNLLAKGGLARPKEDEMTRRLNVLKAFMKGEKSTEEVREEL